MAQKLEGHSIDRFYPYLLLRYKPGDNGNRPIGNDAFWESPDIWTAPGNPAISPALPSTHGGNLVVSQPSTVYAHVWNLGFAPLTGKSWQKRLTVLFSGLRANRIRPDM